MIDWKQVENWAYYADDAHRTIGEFWIDRSRRPKLWRLRHFIRGCEGTTTIALRIEKGTLVQFRGTKYDVMRALMVNGIAHVAKNFGLKPRGEPYKPDMNSLFKTTLTRQP